MANTYTQLYIHIVFAVQGRRNLISAQHREQLHKYITAVVQNDMHKMLAIFCMPDHTHLFVGLNPDISISNLVLDVKRASTNFINQKQLSPVHFNWQKGYGAFSYGKSQIENVVGYILSQEAHHHKQTFKEEYLSLLKKFDVEYDDRYLFDFYD